jgi:hypothetical protein
VAALTASSATASSGSVCARPGGTTVTLTSTADAAATRPATSRAHSAPVSYMLASEPTGTHSSARPREVWDAPTCVVASRIRAAQLPKTAPSKANRAVTAASAGAPVARRAQALGV